MRSESEVRWVRARNTVGQATRLSQWHAMIPGLGTEVPPGAACDTWLSGSLQFIAHSGLRSIDGQKHDVCVTLADEYLATIDPSPGPRTPDEPEIELAPPGKGNP